MVAIDELSDTTVIIENQLSQSNHDHLGKIITYASGLDAEVIIWIVENAREEHRSAIEWLNNHTEEDISFFLIEIHAYRIGNSLPAPNFKVIEQPNTFLMNTKSMSGSNSELNKTQSERINFWEQFNDAIENRGKPFNIRKARKSPYYNVAIGTSEAGIVVTLVNQKNLIRVDFYINDNKTLFDQLYEQKEEIESHFEFKLNWQKLENNKASRISSNIDGLNFDDHSNYPALIEESIDRVLKMRTVFLLYI